MLKYGGVLKHMLSICYIVEPSPGLGSTIKQRLKSILKSMLKSILKSILKYSSESKTYKNIDDRKASSLFLKRA